MGIVIPEGYGQVAVILRHTAVPREAAVVFGIAMDAAFTPTQHVEHVFDAWQATFLLVQDSECVLQRVVGRMRPQGTLDPITVETTQGGVGGGNAGTYPAPHTAVLCRKITAAGGRRGRGRMYVPWAIAEAGVDESGVIAGAQLTPLQNAASGLLNQLEGGPPLLLNVRMVILHDNVKTTKVKVGNVTTITESLVAVPQPFDVETLAVDTRVATQRRRLRS